MKVSKKTKKRVFIILAPILLIFALMSGGFVSMAILAQWDTAVSLGAIITLLLLLVWKES